MSTTTIRLPDDLKARIRQLAQARGMTAHALILEAIAEKADSSERRMDFYDVADARFSRIAESGEAIRWEDMRAYLKAQVQGQPAQRPGVNKLAESRGQD